MSNQKIAEINADLDETQVKINKNINDMTKFVFCEER